MRKISRFGGTNAYLPLHLIRSNHQDPTKDENMKVSSLIDKDLKQWNNSLIASIFFARGSLSYY
jgi:hypothetical protein